MRSGKYILDRIQQETASLPSDDQKLALHTLSFTLKLSEAWPLTRQLVLIMAPKMEQAGERDSWIVYLESGLEQSQQLGDTETEAELCFHLGILYKHLTKFGKAKKQFESSAQYFKKQGNPHNQARALNRLADVARHQCRFDEAKQLVKAALALSATVEAEQAYSYLILGLIAYDQQAWQDAQVFLLESLSLWEKTKEPRMIAWGLTNLGGALWALEKYEEAIACYQRAIQLFEINQDPVHEAIAKMNLGSVYLALGHPLDALELYLLAEPTFRRTQQRLSLAMVNNNKGMAYDKAQQWDKAKQAYKFSLELWAHIGNINALVNVMDNLGLVYLKQGLYKDAIATFQNALAQLKLIKDQPGYEHQFSMINTNLREAMEQKPTRTD
jgi:tetratricopeptide (TPR) repeat protein